MNASEKIAPDDLRRLLIRIYTGLTGCSEQEFQD